MPLEAAIHQFRVLIELYENKIDKKNSYNELVEIFRPGWEIFELLDQQQSNIFLHLIPMLHDAKGDLLKLEQVLGIMLQMPVQVSVVTSQERNTSINSVLGESRLGIDLVAGNTFLEGDDQVMILVGPVISADVLRLTPGERLEQVVRLLVSYFVPADAEVRLEVQVKEREMKLEESVLGYTAFI